ELPAVAPCLRHHLLRAGPGGLRTGGRRGLLRRQTGLRTRRHVASNTSGIALRGRPLHPSRRQKMLDVVVVGAGQAGLSAAYYLARHGLVPETDFVVLDANPAPGGAWLHRWPSLTLGG